MKVLLDYRWPGNVRELANAIEYAVAVSKSETILPEDLPEEVQRPRAEMKPDAKPAGEAARARNLTPGDLESRRILAALEASHWSRDAAARALGMSRTTLWRKMREFRLG
jgi:transcriptional regulator of acetoin/glycerol metabolism